MLKIRLQGTKKDIRWFLKGMERDSRYEVEGVSSFKPCDGDARFRRLYANVRRKGKQNGKGDWEKWRENRERRMPEQKREHGKMR